MPCSRHDSDDDPTWNELKDVIDLLRDKLEPKLSGRMYLVGGAAVRHWGVSQRKTKDIDMVLDLEDSRFRDRHDVKQFLLDTMRHHNHDEDYFHIDHEDEDRALYVRLDRDAPCIKVDLIIAQLEAHLDRNRSTMYFIPPWAPLRHRELVMELPEFIAHKVVSAARRGNRAKQEQDVWDVKKLAQRCDDAFDGFGSSRDARFITLRLWKHIAKFEAKPFPHHGRGEDVWSWFARHHREEYRDIPKLFEPELVEYLEDKDPWLLER